VAKKNLAEVLQADVMTNLPIAALAQIVRSKGRGRDTVLAHITPREARKLKREGGRGSINPETGLLEFQEDFFFDPTPVASQSFDFTAPSYTPEVITQPIQQAPSYDYTFQSTPTQGFAQPFQAADYTGGFQPYTGGESYVGALPGQYAGGNLGPLSGNAIDARSLFVPQPTSVEPPKTDIRVPTTAADLAANRGYYTTPEGVDVATTDKGELALDEQNRADYAAAVQAEKDAAARGQPAGGVAGGGATALNDTSGAPTLGTNNALATAGLDASKLSTADLTRINALQQAVNNGSMTLDQANAAISEMAKSQSFTGGLSKWLSDPGNSLKLALGLGAGALGLYNMSNAKAQAAQVQAQMNKLAQQYKTMAQPFQTQGGLQYGLATQGALTAANQQQFDVARAQLAQAAAKSGSVGGMQATQIAEQIRQQALNNQLTQGLQILAAGNSQMGQAIQMELASLNQRLAMSNQAAQASTNFYTQLAGLFGGAKG
jgi:hypothetical protein